MTRNHLQSSKSSGARLTLIDDVDPDNSSWDAGSPEVLREKGLIPGRKKFELTIEYDELDYDGSDPAMWAVGKDVVWSFDGDIYEGSVNDTRPRMSKMEMEIVVSEDDS